MTVMTLKSCNPLLICPKPVPTGQSKFSLFTKAKITAAEGAVPDGLP